MELMDYCPPIEDKTPQGQSDDSNLFKPNDEGEEILKIGAYPSPSDLKGAAVPLDLAISTKTRTKISDGQRTGESEHRFAAAYRISRSLQAAKRAIEHLGYPVAGDPLELFEDFCLNSKCERGYLGKFSELHQCAAHFETKEHKFGPAELSSNALKRRIAKWATTSGRWCPGEITSHHIRDFKEAGVLQAVCRPMCSGASQQPAPQRLHQRRVGEAEADEPLQGQGHH